MGNKLKGLVTLAGISAAVAYFKKPENREKAQQMVMDGKEKLESFIEEKKMQMNQQEATETPDAEEKKGYSDPYDLPDNEMVSEGAQTSVQYYGQEVEDASDSNEDGLYHKKTKEEE